MPAQEGGVSASAVAWLKARHHGPISYTKTYLSLYSRLLVRRKESQPLSIAITMHKTTTQIARPTEAGTTSAPASARSAAVPWPPPQKARPHTAGTASSDASSSFVLHAILDPTERLAVLRRTFLSVLVLTILSMKTQHAHCGSSSHPSWAKWCSLGWQSYDTNLLNGRLVVLGLVRAAHV